MPYSHVALCLLFESATDLSSLEDSLKMRSVITAALVIHIAFSKPIEDRDTNITNGNANDGSYTNVYDINSGIKQEQQTTEGIIFLPDDTTEIPLDVQPRSLYSNSGIGSTKIRYHARSGVVNANRISINDFKGISGRRSDGSGCRENNEAPRYPGSNGSSWDNRDEDENTGVAIIESRINRNCLKTLLESRFKEDVTLEPSISGSNLEGNKTKNE